MKNKAFSLGVIVMCGLILLPGYLQSKPLKVLVLTGGHDYQEEQFNQMLLSLGSQFDFEVVSFPEAFSVFQPGNRDNYDVLLFYHMWQKISEADAMNLSETIRKGKPLVVLHHSICAFDDWSEYREIIGGKYFTKSSVIDGKEFPPSTYKHDLRFAIQIVDSRHSVTRRLRDFEVLDETYSGLYVHPHSIPLLATKDPTSSPVIGWTKKFGKSQVVTLQSGHDSHTFANPHFIKILKQSVLWVWKQSK